MTTPKIQELKQLGRDAQARGDFATLDKVLDKIESEQSAYESRLATEQDRIARSTGVFPAEFEGGRQPSAEELGLDKPFVEGFAGNVADTVRTIGTGAAAEVLGGYRGLQEGIADVERGGHFSEGADAVNEFKDLLMYRPSTPEAEKTLEDFSGYVQTGADAVGLSQLMKWLETTGRAGAEAGEELGLPPAALAFLETSPQILPELLAAATQTGAVKKLIDTPQVQSILQADVGAPVEAGVDFIQRQVEPIFSQQSKFKQELGRKIQEGSRDPVTAKWMLEDDVRSVNPEELQRIPVDGEAPSIKGLPAPEEAVGFERIKQTIELEAPRVAKDKLAQETIKQGFDEGVIASLKAASPADRRKMRDMVAIKESTIKDPRKGLIVRPSDVVGDSVKDRIAYVASKKAEAGKAIDSAANNLKGKQVSAASAFDGFADDLQDIDVSFDIDTKKPVFEGSTLEGDAPSQKILEIVINRAKAAAKNGGDAYELHKLKRYIDNNVNYGVSKEGLSGDAERIVKRLRRNIDEALDKADPDYDAANTMYADTKTALDAVQDVAGRKIDIQGASADKALGTLSRRLMSNAQSRVNLLDSLDQLEVIGKKYGAQFDDDILVQALFFDELDSVFKPSARTSLHGELAKATERGVRSAASPDAGVLDATAGMLGKAAEKVRGISEENALKAIKELLERE